MSYLEDGASRSVLASMPDTILEWFPTGLGDPCDITEYMSAWSWDGGRSHELDQFEAGNGSVTLTQTVKAAVPRLFDRANPDSPFAPYLRPMRQVRLVGLWDGVRYPVWHGFIADMGDTVDGDVVFSTEWDVKDAAAVLETITLPSSWYELAVRRSAPAHWWKLDELADAPAPLDTGTDVAVGRVVGFYTQGRPTVATTAVVPFDGGRQALTWAGAWINTPNYWPYEADNAGLTIETWFTIDNDALPVTTNQYPLGWLGVWEGSVVRRVQIHMYGNSGANAGKIAARYTSQDGSNEALSTDRYDDGEPHHVVMVVAPTGGQVSLYIDGELVDTDTSGTTANLGYISTSVPLERGAIGTGYFTSDRQVFPGTQSHWITYNRALPADEISDHYNAGANAYSGDRTGERINRVLDAIDWPAGLRDVDTGVSTLGAFELPGGDALSYLRQIVDTELGGLFIDAEDRIVFRSRHYEYLDDRANTSQATIGDAWSGEDLKFDENNFVFGQEFDLIRNPVTAARQDGITVTVEDAELTNPDTGYGSHAWSAPTSLELLDSAMAGRARWLLRRFKQPAVRLASATLEPIDCPALWPIILTARYGDRWTIRRTPGGVGEPIDVDQHVERIGHTGSKYEWTVTVTGTPVDDTDYLIVGVGQIGVGRVGY